MANLLKKYISGLVTLILSLGIVLPFTYLSNIPLTKAATYTVSTTADAGAGSFRQAIVDANGNPGGDTINFTTTGTIALSSTMNAITGETIIDGTTAPDDLIGPDIILSGSSSIDCMVVSNGSNTLIYGIGFTGCRKGVKVDNAAVSNFQVGGTGARQSCYFDGSTTSGISFEAGSSLRAYFNSIGTLSANNVGITISGGNTIAIGGDSAMQGNEIVSSTTHGINITGGTSVALAGNVIGARFAGTIAGNGENGINANNGSVTSLIIGGVTAANQILGNAQNGILIGPNTQFSTIRNNYIGISATGFIAGNAQNGIHLNSGNHTVGGATSSQRNYISGNTLSGVYVTGTASSNNLISKNYIGVSASGSVAKPNIQNGIKIDEWVTGTQIITNQIASNSLSGIYTTNTSTGTLIYDNGIGVGSSGQALGNGSHGVEAYGTVKIGTANVDVNKNIIGSNVGNGILISGTGASNSIIELNEIGRLADQSPRGNGGSGILVDGGATDVYIGAHNGTPQAIANNAIAGIKVDGASTDRIAILENNLPDNGLAPIIFTNSPNAGKVPDVTITTANTSGIAGTYGSSGPTEIFYLSGTGSLAMFENYNTVDPDLSFVVSGLGLTNDNYWVYSYDVTNRRSSATTGTGTLVADLTPPSEPILTSATGTTINPTYILAGTKEAYSAVYNAGSLVIATDSLTSWTASPLTLIEGLNTFLLDSRDLSNNISTTGTYYVTLDTIAPTPPTLVYDPLYSGESSIISGSGEVATLIYVNDVYTTTVAGDGSFTLSVSTIVGANIFNIRAVDAFARTSSTVTAIIAPSGGTSGGGQNTGLPTYIPNASLVEEDEGQSMAGEPEIGTESTEETITVVPEVNLAPVEETNTDMTQVEPEQVVKETYSNLYAPDTNEVTEIPVQKETAEKPEEILVQQEPIAFSPILLKSDFMGEKGTDGIPLWWKDQNFGSGLELAVDTDTDKDGLPDIKEFLYGTDPKSNDSDKDGVADTVELANGSNPASYDTDGDGIADEMEKPEEVSKFNPKIVDETISNIDTDKDGLSDGQEQQMGTDPRNDDSDSDGLTDGTEVLLYDTNPAKASKVAGISIGNVKKGQVNSVGEQYMMGGTDSPDTDVSIYLIDAEGNQTTIGTTKTDAKGLYSLSTSELGEGKYTVAAVLSKDNKTISVSYPQDLIVSKEVSIKAPEIAVKVDGNNATIDGLSQSEDTSIVVTWRRLVLTNTIVADQNFKLTAPEGLEAGEHTATVYSVSNLDNSQSKPVQVQFTLTTTGFAGGQTEEISPLITIGGSALVLLSLIALALFRRRPAK